MTSINAALENRGRVLLVEDEAYVRDSMAEVLRQEGLQVLEADSVRAATAALAEDPPDVILTDLRLPVESGLALLELPEVVASAIPVILITGHGTVEDAVSAMKRGAWDFVQKPIDPDNLVLAVERALQHRQLEGEVRRLRTAFDRLRAERGILGRSPAMTEVRRLIAQVAPTDATVLVTGETGTGKELVCIELHATSPRARGPLVFQNCAAIPEGLVESEFFGHKKGSFTGATEDRQGRLEEARGGTLVLDEIEALKPDAQAKLLRVLESREYQRVGDAKPRRMDCRIVAASNEDLRARVAAGSFRSDLFWRLEVFPIHMPPLREHLADVPEIAVKMLERLRVRTGIPAPRGGDRLDAEVSGLLTGYAWPGNVRELRNVLERALILAGPERALGAEILAPLLAQRAPSAAPRGEPHSLNLRERREALERDLVARALESSGGQRKEAAHLLGIDPKNMAYYMKKHGLMEGGG
jgi:DNA-binding NtrC family response regulator